MKHPYYVEEVAVFTNDETTMTSVTLWNPGAAKRFRMFAPDYLIDAFRDAYRSRRTIDIDDDVIAELLKNPPGGKIHL